MKALGLRCVNCNKDYRLGLNYHCESCRYPLEVIYAPTGAKELFEEISKCGIWRYQDSLPPIPNDFQISLGEGNTPLLHARKLGEDLGLPNLYIKNEGQNPTGSFKDRPTAVGISMALSFGLETVAVSSTGNAGASLAAYAAQAGLRALIFVTDQTPPAKLVQMQLHGARIVPVRGSLSDAFWLAYNASIEWNWMNLTSTFLNPFTMEGDKTVAYELYRQLGRSPDWILVPVSVGPLLVGILKGFIELQERGLVETLPRMVAAQAAGCAPIAKAFANGEEFVKPWTLAVNTVAGGIADPLTGYENDGTYALQVIRGSGGIATASSDEEILEATRGLARLEGIFAEPTGAVSLAALNHLRYSPNFSPNQLVACVVTGHGLKQVHTFEASMELPAAIEPNLPSLSHLLGDHI
jgi:threonine synthase